MFNISEVEKSFSLLKLEDNFNKINEIFILQQLSLIAVKASKLLHEIQKERGHSIWHLGTKGENLKELNKQRKKTEKKILEFENYIISINTESFNKEIRNIIYNIITQFSTLEKTRERINFLKENIDNSITYFSDLISILISLIEMLCKFNLNPKLTKGINSYIFLLKLKEKTGQERAVLTGTFSENKFNIIRINFFQKVLGEQKLYEEKFLNKATKEQISLYNSKIENGILNEINDFRKIAIKNKNTNNFGVSTSQWFQIITNKIELLKEVEDKIVFDINNDIGNLKSTFNNEAKNLLLNMSNI